MARSVIDTVYTYANIAVFSLTTNKSSIRAEPENCLINNLKRVLNYCDFQSGDTFLLIQDSGGSAETDDPTSSAK